MWASGVQLDYCHPVRLWEDAIHETAANLGHDMCYKLAFDSSYSIWKYKMEECALLADGVVCAGINTRRK